jgi:DNA-binding Lrp family transcriptional regulator
MPKSSRKQIDLDEKKVIAELQKNSKESIDVIANKCGFSRQKVWRIIKRLEDSKTIWTYHAVIDSEKMDLNKYILLLKRTTNPIQAEQLEMTVSGDLDRLLKEMDISVDFAFYLNGCYDFALCVSAHNVKDLKKLTETINKMFRDYISEIEVLEVIFPMVKCGSMNPNIKELRQFFLS